MTFDSGFLGPRDFLVNGKFCIEESTVLEVRLFVQRARDLPLTEYALVNLYGVEDFQYNDLYDIFQRLLVEYNNIHQECAVHSGLFKELQHICERLIDLSSSAKQDYDPIFANLKKIYNGEGDTDALRRDVEADINTRLTEIGEVESSVETATTTINTWDNANVVHKARLGAIITDIEQRVKDTPELEKKRDGFWGNFGDPVWRLEMGAVLDLLFSSVVVGDFQSLLGGWHALKSDLAGLSEFIKNNTEPAPGLLANLEENSILYQWQLLEPTVRDLLDNSIKPAVAENQ
ncbi:hypothetical protein BDV12DRAFT_75346 [Aspergillus spectabilis]